MSNNAKAVKSIRKTDLVSQKTPFVAFKAFSFAHEATAGQTVISLSALTVPTSYASRGFVQPSASDLSAANLLLYRRNLRLQSTLRGVLMEYDAYDVTGSMTIRLNFPAEAGEIFIGVISDVSKTGVQVIDGQSLVSTGVLGANASDYVVGQSFALNKYSTKQVGDVLVFLDGQLMYRNVGNATASVSADGNYQEIDAGSGLSNTIRFNIVDPVNARPITVLSNGMLAERPEGSLRAEIETLAGQNDSIIETLAVVAGVPTTNFRSAPNSVDLQTFGQRLITMESNRARIDLANTWTAYQPLLGRTDGLAIPAGIVGEKITWVSAPSNLSLTTSMQDWTNAFITLTPGVWNVFANISITVNTASAAGDTEFAQIVITDSSNAIVQEMDRLFLVKTVAAVVNSAQGNLSFAYQISVSVNTVHKIRALKTDLTGVGSASILNSAGQRSQFFAIRA